MGRLAEKGVTYLALNETRQRITSRINNGLAKASDLSLLLKESACLLISDENILGGTDKPKSGGIYPGAAGRLQKVLDALKPDDIEVHLTIRDPESYMVSRYCEYLRHFQFLPIHQYYDELFVGGFSWLPLIRDIEAVVANHVTVSCFETMFLDEPAYFAKLLGVNVELAEADRNPATRRSKVSSEAYEILNDAAMHFPDAVIRRLISAMDSAEQTSPKTAIKPFSPALSKQLKASYVNDRNELGLKA